MIRSLAHASSFFALLIFSCIIVGCGSDSPTPPGTTYSISGKVTPTAAESVEGVVVTVGSRKDTTDGSGNWSLSGLESGTYTISPAKPDNSFAPPTRTATVSNANVTDQDFVIAGDKIVPSHPEMILVQAGTFMMGGTRGRVGSTGEWPKHQVTLTRSFLVAKTEVTQEQFTSVMGFNPSRDTIVNGPVSCVTFIDMVEYCNKLSDAEGLQRAYTINSPNFTWDRSANGYRLPTNAEWEYAARAGDTNNTYNGYYDGKNPSAVLDEIAWYRYNTSPAPEYLPDNAMPQPVGLKKPNALGLHDVIGNLFEVVIDGYADYTNDAVTDPYVEHDPLKTVLRGGACGSEGGQTTLSDRETGGPRTRQNWTTGFRIVRTN